MDEAEKSYLIDKRYTCPVCDSKITAKTVKSNAAKFVDTKADLRPIHSNINVTKYDAVCCPHCGYAALAKDFNNTTSTQRKLIRDNIQSYFKERNETELDSYTTDVAIARMKMALLCTVTKGGKSSEIGNICLKICWLYQSLAEEVSDDDENADTKRENYLKEADNAGLKAYEHLTTARMKETYPIAGMNETTLDYLLSYFAYKKGEYSTSMKLLSNVISNRSITPRLKDKCVELKELLAPKLHDQNGQTA